MDNNGIPTEPGLKYMASSSFDDMMDCEAKLAVTVSDVEKHGPVPDIKTLLNPVAKSEFETPFVIFTCTHWKGGSPTISPFPTNGTDEMKYHRLKMRLDDILKDTTLYIPKNSKVEYPSPGLVDYFYIEVARTDEEKKYWAQDNDYEVLDTDHKNPFIYKIQGKWRCNEYFKCKYRYFVNLVFNPGLDPTYKHSFDTVRKTKEYTEQSPDQLYLNDPAFF